MAHEILKVLLSANTAPNLWDLHPPFQIDGNLGGISGIAEMLMQSHAGFIHPLPAIPDEWSCGSLDGLVARGAFTVGMDWSERRVDRMRIYSAKGGKVSVLLNGEYSVTTRSGAQVVSRFDGNRLSFDTQPAESYSIIRMSAD
jgi:alpha-L-fucosidase 2